MIEMASSETEPNLFALCKPTGILAKALYSGRKVVFLCLVISIAINFLTWILQFWLATNITVKIYSAIYSIYRISYVTFILLLYLNRKKYIDLFNHFERNAEISSLCPSLVRYLEKNRLSMKIQMVLSYSCFFVLRTMYLAENFNSLEEIFLNTVHFIIKSQGLLSCFIFLRFFAETCLYIQCCFMQVEHQIDIFRSSTDRFSVNNVRQIRHLYCLAVEITEKFDYLLLPVTCFNFAFSLIEGHFAFANAIKYHNLTALLTCIGEFSILLLIVLQMISINHRATRIYEKVYSFSFRTDSLNASKEVQLLLVRIAHADVGLTFLGIFVITPTCVTSLATISLTIALAAPTILY
uniref:Gustatory receptor n=1 Tax=Tetranychus urticae TaxID=32264 RepID=T1KCM3_TETUR